MTDIVNTIDSAQQKGCAADFREAVLPPATSKQPCRALSGRRSAAKTPQTASSETFYQKLNPSSYLTGVAMMLVSERLTRPGNPGLWENDDRD